jgi:tetratricopeptide (TPR) repeat protein
MNVQLPNPSARGAVIIFSAALAALLAYFGLRDALATYYLDLDTRSGYERAVRLEPANSRNWFFLGRSYLYDFEQPDTPLAILALQRAVALDRYSAESLLDLANAYDGEGDTARARETFLAAQRIYPLSADVCWSYGNFLLRQGEQDAAFREIHRAVELDPKRAAEAFSRALLVQPDASILLDRAVPASPEVYLAILNLLAGTGDLKSAELVWERLLALHQKVPIRAMVNFVDELLHQQRGADAVRAWNQAVTIMQNQPPPDAEGSLLWDGGFESGFSGAGFAWRFLPASSDVLISFDRSEKHTGSESLRILFNGHENLRFEDVCHHIVPQPGQTYLLTAWVKTQSLTSSEGVRLQIFVYTPAGNQTVATEEVHGTQPWKQIRLQWTAPPGANFGEVCARREMSGEFGADIQGAAWIDDVSLAPAPAPGVPAQP